MAELQTVPAQSLMRWCLLQCVCHSTTITFVTGSGQSQSNTRVVQKRATVPGLIHLCTHSMHINFKFLFQVRIPVAAL